MFRQIRDKYLYKIQQFAIDLLELIEEDLTCTDNYNSLEETIGHLHYKISTALEICDQSLIDYQLLQELDKLFE